MNTETMKNYKDTESLTRSDINRLEPSVELDMIIGELVMKWSVADWNKRFLMNRSDFSGKIGFAFDALEKLMADYDIKVADLSYSGGEWHCMIGPGSLGASASDKNKTMAVIKAILLFKREISNRETYSGI